MKALLLILLCSQLSIIILTCENGCGTNEICISQKCVCDNGWFGPSCNLYADQLQAGVMTSKNISEDAWSYFYYPFKGKQL